jgi:Arc/MetJ-type ribon-helix-helix transcriptional regulator
MTERITFSVDDELAERINSRLNYGDNRSELLRELIRRGLDDMSEQPSPDPEPTSATKPQAAAAEREPRDTDAAVAAVVDEVAASWAADERLEARKEAARRVLAHAMDTDDAVGKSSAIVEEVFDECPVPGQDRETWWRKNIRPVLKEAGEYSAGRHGYVVTEEE